MRILRLKITDPAGFRSLQEGFEVHFLREWNYSEVKDFNPYVLVGPNGSGKSNVLEALAAIFFHMECIYLHYRPDSFEFSEEDNQNGFRSDVSSPDAFELEYLIQPPDRLEQKNNEEMAHIKISKEKGKPPVVIWENRSQFEDGKIAELSRIEVKEIFPEYVLGYSSGENEILSLPFFKTRFIHFDEYRSILMKDDFYGQVPEGRLVYLDEHLNQSILLSNLLLQDYQTLKVFEDILQLNGVKRFSIIIGKHHYETFHHDILKQLSNEEIKSELNTKIELTKKLDKTINKLEKCSTTKHTYFVEEKEFLILDFVVTDETKKAFRFYFDTPLALFQSLQILYTLNYCTITDKNRKRIYNSKNIFLKQDLTSITLDDDSIFRIKEFRLQKCDIKDTIYTRSLSDGEHQLIHSIGLCMIYKHKKALFLLDEPETHFNPDWRAKFISRLRDCFNNTDSHLTMREMLITTHTPFLISDSKKEYVLVFNKNTESKSVEVTRPDYNTFGASINKITMKSFGKTETIGGYAEKQLNEIKERFEAGAAKQELIDEVNNLLGDSVEKVLFIKRVLDSMGDI